MLQDFNIKATLNNKKNQELIQEKYENVINQLNSMGVLQYIQENSKQEILTQYEKATIEKENSNLLDKIQNIFHKGKIYKANNKIESSKEKLNIIEEELKQIQSKVEELKRQRDNLEKKIEKTPIFLKEKNGDMVITDEEDERYSRDCQLTEYEKDPNEMVLVHCTNFFPRNNKILSDYDGNKKTKRTMIYNEEEKDVEALIHRHEVHFTINNRVENTGAGEGNWDNPTYIVIDKYNVHQDELENFSESDTWTKGSSLKLSKDSIIMVRIQDKDKLPIEEGEEYNIIYYDGDATSCLRNFLKFNNYNIFETNPNCPAHAASARKQQEDGTTGRDLAINFIRDNNYDPKVAQEFSKQEIAKILDVFIKNCCSRAILRAPVYRHVDNMNLPEDKIGYYKQAIAFVIGSGLKRVNDDEYTFVSDEEVLKHIEEVIKWSDEYVKNDSISLPSWLDLNVINEIYEEQQRISNENVIEPVLREIENKLSNDNKMKFDDILDLYGDKLYEYTTEERRKEFLENHEIALSEAEMKIFKNKELKELYVDVMNIKNIPYGKLSIKEQDKFQKFKRLYNCCFDEYDVSTELEFNDNGEYVGEKGAIFKKDDSCFLQNEINSLGKKYQSNIENFKIILDYKLLDDNTTLTEYMENCENMMSEVKEMLEKKEKVTEGKSMQEPAINEYGKIGRPNNEKRFTPEEIGKATINTPTKDKNEASQIEGDALKEQGKTNAKEGESISNN